MDLYHILSITIGGIAFGRVPQKLTNPKFVEEGQKAVRKIKNSKLFKDAELTGAEIVPGWILSTTLGV